MAVRWTITFKTLTNRTGLVKVYDSNYSGDPIAIEPAVNAFSTTSQQQDFFQPVVPDSGYLRIVDNGIAAQGIEDIHPLGALDRPVEFYLDNVLTWRGYISPESFSVGWEPAPREVEFPLVGVLDVLDSVDIQVGNADIYTIAYFLKLILTATGFSWTSVIMSRQMASVDSFTDCPELRIGLSRNAFLKRNNSNNLDDPDWSAFNGESYLTVLRKICLYFGWTASQHGTKLILADSRLDMVDVGMVELSWSDLSALAADYSDTVSPTSFVRTVIALSSLNYDGIGHRKSLRNGRKKITVQTNVESNDSLYPQITYNGAQLRAYSKNEPVGYHSNYCNGYLRFLDPSKEQITLYVYQWDSERETFARYAWAAPSGAAFVQTPRGDIVMGASFISDGVPQNAKPKYTPYLRVSYRDAQSHTVSENSVIAVLSAPESGYFSKNGCLCISSTVRGNYSFEYEDPETQEPVTYVDRDGMTQYVAGLIKIRMRISIGEKFYNGSEWVTTPTIITIPVENLNSTTSKIKDNNDNRYVNAAGYVIPIADDMIGQVVIELFRPANNVLRGEDNTYFLTDFSVRYYNDFVTENQKALGVRLSTLTGIAFKDDSETVLNLSSLASDGAPAPSNAYLFWEGIPIGSDDIFEYNNEAETTLAQPEYWLLDSLVKAYSKPSEWLELEMELDDDIQLYSIITYGGKKYLVTGMETAYDSEHIKLWIASYE